MPYRPHEFGELIGKSVSTLRRWDREGKLVPQRGLGNQRYYTEDDLKKALKLETGKVGKIVVYCRVSSRNQKDDLANQIKSMESFCINRGTTVDQWISEIGGGLNFKRPKFLALMKSIRLGEVKTLIVAHKDRLARFGYDFIEEFASWFECEVVVANTESLSPHQELTEDLMSIIHCFSCRLYGLRRYKKEIKKLISESG